MNMTKQKNNVFACRLRKGLMQVGTGEGGSIIVIAIIILVLLSLGGIGATQRSLTESFIVRNSAIHKQNLQLAEMAAMEGLRVLMNLNNQGQVAELWPSTTAQPWVHGVDTWNDNLSDADETDPDSFPLVDANSAVPLVVTNNDIDIMNDRGEAADGNLRYYFVGWRSVPGTGLGLGAPALWRQGRVVGVYESERNGRAWVEMGVRLRFGTPQ